MFCRYLFNVAYGVGKAGCDRMAADCAHELKKSGVSMISLWPGPVKTEFIQENMIKVSTAVSDSGPAATKEQAQMAKVFENGETIEFAGKVVVHLAADKNIMARSGKIINTAELESNISQVVSHSERPFQFSSRCPGCYQVVGQYELL